MPRRSTAAGQLARVLQAVTRPVYLLDAERTIRFCNSACAAWTGAAAEDLMGETCNYHSPGDERGPAAVAARLCPPPEAFRGRRSAGQVAAVSPAGELVFRQAEFLPLAEPGAACELLVIATATDGAAPELAAEESPADAAHLELLRMRHRFAGRYALDRMLGPSPTAIRVRAQVQLASAAPANVLIVGPAGAGKEHVAKAIHYRQPIDRLRSLVPIACSALDAELLLSTVESLVAKAGAAKPDAPGTLWLRDVDRLSQDLQPQVLRALKAAAAPRVISTTCRGLDWLAVEAHFIPDLLAWLSTLTIELAPLADRRQDVPLLAQMFLEELNAKGVRQRSRFTPQALDQLAAYHWPGNLDELAQMVREARDETTGSEIAPGDLPKRMHLAAEVALCPRRAQEPIELEKVLERVETELIERALERAKGNKSREAELLGLSRPRLYRRLVQLGLTGADDVEFEEME